MTPPAVSRPTAEHGLLLRLAGPLQSWGTHSHFNERDTAPFPTRSAIIGLLAAALGRQRHEPIDDLTQLSLTVRTDRPGVLLRDLHTVGGGLPAKATVTTAEGKKRSGHHTTLLTHRTYLADAAFTVALTHPDGNHPILHTCAQALTRPQWPLYLGRRSCPPEGPLLLGTTNDALHHLLHLPIAAPPPKNHDTAHGITFTSDRTLTHLPAPTNWGHPAPHEADQTAGEITDQPTTFHPRRRTYLTRMLYQLTLQPPRTQYHGLGTAHLQALSTYLNHHMNTTQRSGQ
ncbi:type I-E CRISPR-associated protein Cas5/CasD [Streptomyces sp. NPDC053493]|uniref:type I-E CRISPR-associated protein Cas5/CasD n=1 Tax=Streptomyces sp. NPDC053493 TaxID=3365705 RepID=UPI0037D411FC